MKKRQKEKDSKPGKAKSPLSLKKTPRLYQKRKELSN